MTLCFTSYQIFAVMLTKVEAFSVSQQFWFHFWIISVDFNFKFSKSSSFCMLKSYTTSFEERSVNIFFKLLRLAQRVIRNSDHFFSEFNVRKYQRAILMIWLNHSDCLSNCRWYAVLIRSLVLRLSKMIFHISERNLESQSKIIIIRISQSVKLRSRTLTHWVTEYVSFSVKIVTCLLNLQVMLRAQLYSSFNKSRVRIKSMVIVWKKISEVLISFSDLFDRCHLI